MTTREMVVEVLREHPCLNSFEIKGFVFRKFGETISPQSAAGTLRPLIAAGKVGKDNHTGKTVYWLKEEVNV